MKVGISATIEKDMKERLKKESIEKKWSVSVLLQDILEKFYAQKDKEKTDGK